MIHRTKLTLALTAAAALMAAAASAGPTSAGAHRHKCVERAPGDCPNQHPVIHGLPVYHQGLLLPAVQRTSRWARSPSKQAGSATPGLFGHLQTAHGGGHRGGGVIRTGSR